MQAAPARYVSVSELYATDEVELLLDEIRELEPTSCRGEDLQDFEIAGSGCGAGAGGRSPAGTELTERSWDSHAQYRRAGAGPARALAPLYCHAGALRGVRPAAALALLALSGAACACAWAAGGWRLARLAPAARPAARLLLLAALSTALLHAALLAARVSRLHELLALRWARAADACAAWALLGLGAGGARLALLALLAPQPQPAPLPAAAALALAGSAVAGASLARGLRDCWRARAAARGPSPSARAAYRVIPDHRRTCKYIANGIRNAKRFQNESHTTDKFHDAVSDDFAPGPKPYLPMEQRSLGVVGPPIQQNQSEIVRNYYTDNDYFVSPEGILKIVGAVCCAVWAAWLAGAARCASVATGPAALAGAGAASAAATALLYLGVALGAPRASALAWLYLDIVVSTAAGAALLAAAGLGAALCDRDLCRGTEYVHGLLAMASAGMMAGSAVITYVSVMRRWDAARLRVEPTRPTPSEQDA